MKTPALFKILTIAGVAMYIVPAAFADGALTAKIAAKYTVKKTDVWYGGERTVFDFEGYDAWVIEPPADVKPAEGKPWTWTLQWRSAFTPETGVPRLLKLGWHHAALDSLGIKDIPNGGDLELNKRFHDFLVNDLGLNAKANLIGMSWGGFFSTRYSATYPADVAKLYLDAPLLNFEGFKSVPGDWQQTMPAKGWKEDPRMPVNMARKLADTDIRILLLYGGKDEVVPPTYSCNRFVVFYKSAGGNLENLKVIPRPGQGHHPHGVKAGDDTIVDFFAGDKSGLIPEAKARLKRANAWYLPGRIGMFYHYGLYTGGGCRSANKKYDSPLKYPTPADFEAAAPDPAAVAKNLVQGAKSFGAKYVILTTWHTCGQHMMLYPTKIPEFYTKTTKDYIGAYLDECHKAGLKAVLYFPTDASNWNADPERPSIDPRCGMPLENNDWTYFQDFLKRTLAELHERYGAKIDGFWIDGGFPVQTRQIPATIRELWPDAVIIGNNISDFRVECDISTSEICPNDEKRTPAYNLPDSYRRIGSFGQTPPQRDLNEVDLNLAGWWYSGEKGKENEYVKDPRLLVKKVACILGQRGRWNATIAVGPRIDGTVPPFQRSAAEAMQKFLAWASPAVYNTKGAADTFFDAGFAGSLNGGSTAAFYSVTQSLADEKVFYAIITEARYDKTNISYFMTNGHKPRRVSDLRTGKLYEFTVPYGVRIDNLDFSDIETYGATVLKFEF